MASSRIKDGFAGAASAVIALGVSELAAGLLSGLPSLIEGLGNWVIDNTPEPVKHWAILLFGTNDKLVLLIGITLVAVIFGVGLGIVARKRFGLATSGFVGFGLLAALAAARDPEIGLAITIIPGGLAALSGLSVLQWLLGYASHSEEEKEGPEDVSRRAFVMGIGAVVGVAALAAGFGRLLLERSKRAISGRSEIALPAPARPVPPIPPGAELGVEGLSPVITPNDVFYRIDTAFAVPRVSLPNWTLTVKGRVDRPYTVDFFDLLDMRLEEKHITLSCVSNEIGGGLVGTAKWLGVPLKEILDRARPRSDAEQLVGRSVGGFTVGFPVEAAYDGREALLAIGMNDEPLPFEHGFPARLVVSGLYGYVSATKWLSEIELTGWDEFDAYWIRGGVWAKQAPIKTQSRIDTPNKLRLPDTGERVVAGVAWAPHRGISKVEVQLGEDAPWVEAELSEPLSDDTWRQWRVMWEASPGPPHPDGAGNRR